MSAGLSASRLARMHDVLADHVDRGSVPGLVTLVSRHGETHVDAIGAMALGGAEPMRRDAIFRIASLTKPVIAVATLFLVEDCAIHLDDPIEQFLPELADRRVLRELDAELDDTVPARRSITVRDALTFRNGLGMRFDLPDHLPIVRSLKGLSGFGPPNPSDPIGPDEWIAQLGAVPLMHHPGERWLYNAGSEILGVLIARVSGKPLADFLNERVFVPLGMVDSGFVVPEAKLDRLPAAYFADPVTGDLSLDDEPATTVHRTPPTLPSAGGGLLSTVDDYFTFTELLRNHGRHGTKRLLSRHFVEAMRTDQLTPEQKAVSGFFPDYFESRGWGFGVAVGTKRDGLETPGRYGWDGGSGTSWYTDPAEGLTAILFTQRGGFPQASPVYLDFWASVQSALH